MIASGLLSVTFRTLTPERIIGLAAKAGLQAIEWGGDIHVPHGDSGRAKEVGRRTRDAGLRIASYGSYYKTAVAESPDFESVLETALALGAPAVRVWAGNKGSDAADEAWRERTVLDALRIAGLAAQAGVTVDFEYHRGTLTDTSDSAIRLLLDAAHPAIRCNWQPPVHETFEQRLEGLRRIVPWLANIHVFHWLPGVRCPLADGFADWRSYAGVVKETGKPHCMMLEFVKDDSPEQFAEDAETLKRIMG